MTDPRDEQTRGWSSVEAAERRRRSRIRSALTFAWALLPLFFGLFSALIFAWAAWRRRSRALALEAAAYFAVTVTYLVLADRHGTVQVAAVLLDLVLIAVATTRALVIRRQIFPPKRAMTVPPPLPANWQPTFPAGIAGAENPAEPGTYLTGFECNGHDSHLLSLPASRYGPAMLTGIGWLVIDCLVPSLHQSLGFAIGLVLAPLLIAMSSRRVEGPSLTYRNLGVRHQVSLLDVTAVDTVGQRPTSSTLVLRGPRLAGPVKLSVTWQGFVVSRDAREHLGGWLSRPDVLISRAAEGLLKTGEPITPRRPLKPRYRAIFTLLSLVGPLMTFGVGGFLLIPSDAPRLAIRGAPGYFTTTGPDGKPLAFGRPWGTSCEPVVFQVNNQVPASVFDQVNTVVSQARLDGLNITLENRTYFWQIDTVRLPSGQTPADVPVVPIFWNADSLNYLTNGEPEHIGFGWNARPDEDGTNEDLTSLQGILFARALNNNAFAERRAIRQLVAFAEGVASTTMKDSGIRDGSNVDGLSGPDVRAITTMSGCPS